MYKHLKTGLAILILAAFLITLNSCGNGSNNKDSQISLENEERDVGSQQKLLRHVVLFNFNEKASAEIVNKIEQEFAALPEKISEIHSFEWGTNNSPEGLNKDLTHCFLVTFLSEEDRAKYLPHPDHQEFVTLIGDYIEDVTVVDYWTM